MRFNLPRVFVSALLVAAFLVAPLPAAAAPWGSGSIFESGWGTVVGWTGNLLRLLWAEEGGTFDPLGLAGTAPMSPADAGRHLWAEEGGSFDPLGRTTPPPAATAPEGQ